MGGPFLTTFPRDLIGMDIRSVLHDGDYLVVNDLALDERAWMDEWGTPMSAGAKIEERWQRTAADKLQVKITVNDPITFTRAWTSSPIIYTLQHGYDPQEIIFAPMDENAFNQQIRNPARGENKPGRRNGLPINYRGLIGFAKYVLPAGLAFAVLVQQPAPLPAQDAPAKKAPEGPATPVLFPRSLAAVPSRRAISRDAGRNQ